MSDKIEALKAEIDQLNHENESLRKERDILSEKQKSENIINNITVEGYSHLGMCRFVSKLLNDLGEKKIKVKIEVIDAE